MSPSSTAHWVVEVQAAIQRGAASARADPKESIAQGEATKATPTQTGEGAPLPREAEARESNRAEAPSIAKATEVKAPWASEAEATEVGVPRTAEAVVAGARAPGTTEAMVAEADVSAAKPAAQEVEMKAAEASVAPLEVVDAKVTDTVEQPALTLGEGSSALVRVRLEPRGWDHPCVLWQSWDDPEGEPLFALEDAAEGGRWDTFEQYRQLAEQSMRTTLSVVADDLPGVAQKDLLAHANELLSARSAEVEDLRLRGADMKAAAAVAQEQVAPLAAWVKELEEELTRVAGDRDAFRSRAREATASVKALAGQLGTEQGAHQLTKGALDEALKSATRTACEALEVEGVQSGSSLRSRLIALSGQVCERLRGALHTGVKRALVVIASHYISVDLKAISDGYVLPNDDGEANKEVAKLIEATEGPGTVLAKLFEEEVVPPTSSADAGDPES
ncbi:basal body protein 10-like [Miscanthus floridulus]|uniref:basal body protein 10-like n=1 Tax=Miscanthus floridulus TaxID=154761 RepID=UPI00345AE34B